MRRLAACLILPLLLAGCAHDRAYGGLDVSLNAPPHGALTASLLPNAAKGRA